MTNCLRTVDKPASCMGEWLMPETLPDPKLYGVCGKCWQSYRVKKDGNLRSHTNLDSHITKLPFSSHCDGSGTTPTRTYLYPMVNDQ